MATKLRSFSLTICEDGRWTHPTVIWPSAPQAFAPAIRAMTLESATENLMVVAAYPQLFVEYICASGSSCRPHARSREGALPKACARAEGNHNARANLNQRKGRPGQRATREVLCSEHGPARTYDMCVSRGVSMCAIEALQARRTIPSALGAGTTKDSQRDDQVLEVY